jgi:predicted nucleic acid-binding protein
MAAEPERLLCLDTSVLIRCLATDEQTPAAVLLLETAVSDGSNLVAPAFAWAEVASVLRKKRRAGLLQPDEAQTLWTAFLNLPITYLDTRLLRERAWALADQYALATLYDAAFLACTEIAPAPPTAERAFWTADDVLLQQLGLRLPAYVRRLSVPN